MSPVIGLLSYWVIRLLSYLVNGYRFAIAIAIVIAIAIAIAIVIVIVIVMGYWVIRLLSYLVNGYRFAITTVTAFYNWVSWFRIASTYHLLPTGDCRLPTFHTGYRILSSRLTATATVTVTVIGNRVIELLSYLVIWYRFVIVIAIAIVILFLSSCTEDMMPAPVDEGDLVQIPYDPVAYDLNLPAHFPAMPVPPDNPLTHDGVELGKHLFYDPILSSDSTLSCSSCHLPSGNFTDNEALSTGVTGMAGKRSAMSLLNIGFNTNGFFWDGRASTLEAQALEPVEDPIELHEAWPDVIEKLQRHPDYPEMFRRAFGIQNTREIDRDLAVKAIAQFERILVSSGKSKYDQVISGDAVFTDLELDGHDIFFDINPDRSRHAECGHCHNAPLFTTNEYFNNGIDPVGSLEEFSDKGRGEVTGIRFDFGTFRVPTLRNIEFSAPYMHDGRFQTLDEVIDHYITGGHSADNLGAVLRPLNLSEYDREALVAFIRTLSDPDFIENPELQSPFE